MLVGLEFFATRRNAAVLGAFGVVLVVGLALAGAGISPWLATALVVLAIGYLELARTTFSFPWHLALVTGFGVVHGLGFGGGLIGVPDDRFVAALGGFNLGAELGQLAAAAAAVGAGWLFARLPGFRDRAAAGVMLLATFTVACGAFWFVGRSL